MSQNSTTLEYTAKVFVSDSRGVAEAFLEGTDTTTLSDPPKTGLDYDLYIGYNQTSGRYFDGWIDDVIIYDQALTDAEIEAYFDDSKGVHGY
jgi:hypothetical protein